MSLLGLHREHPHNTSTAYISSSTTHLNRIRPGARLASHMDERERPSSSRKRHRSDDISGSSFRLPQSNKDGRMRAGGVGNTTHPDHEASIPTSDPQAPAPEPLHPPINFSAISQGTTSPNSMPSSTTDATPATTTLNYSTTLPLPNPGRAHRFCQVCEQINHVRRKLCTKCGAPKPSAVRNAVGVRPISEVDSSADRRNQGDTNFRPDNYGQPHVQAPPFHLDAHNRFTPHGLGQPDRYSRQMDTAFQARPLTMKSGGDDIPLYNTAPGRAPQPSYPLHETHAARKIRAGPGILAGPLVTFSSPLGQFPSAPHKPYGNGSDLQQKQFHPHATEREQSFPLPSTQEIPPHIQNRNLTGGLDHRALSRPPLMSAIGSRSLPHVQDDGLPEDVLNLNRHPMNSFDPRHNSTRRFQPTPGLRPYSNEQSQGHTYGGVSDAQGLLYRSGQDLFSQQPHMRQDDRSNIVSQDPSRGQKYAHSLSVSPAGDEREYPPPHLAVRRGQSGTILAEQQQHPSMRRGLEDDRTRHLSLDSRPEPTGYRQIQKNEEYVNVNPTQFEEPSRHHDDGRLGIDNILMQHKSSSQND